MAQAIEGFDAAAFRLGIRTAMRMGLPVQEERWPQFVMPATVPAGADAHGVAWDPEATAASVEPASFRPLCALEWLDPAPVRSDYASLDPMVLHVTMLDEEYRQVEGFEYVNIWAANDGDPVRFYYRKIRQQPTLDVVGVWQVEVATRDAL